MFLARRERRGRRLEWELELTGRTVAALIIPIARHRDVDGEEADRDGAEERSGTRREAPTAAPDPPHHHRGEEQCVRRLGEREQTEERRGDSVASRPEEPRRAARRGVGPRNFLIE